MNLTTFSARGAAAVVAGVAGFASYRHITHVAIIAGESAPVAYALPLAIDGLIVVGTMAMLEDKRANRVPRMSARFALGFGVIATLAANVASAEPTWLARAVAAVPAVAFLIAVEVLSRSGHLKTAEPLVEAPEPGEAPARPVMADVMTPAPAVRPVKKAPAAVKVAKIRSQHPAMPQEEVAKRAGVSVRTVARHWPDTVPTVNGTDVPQLVR